MAFFGSTTKLSSSTTTQNKDQRTLAEAGGVAAQSVGGNLTFEDVSDEAIEAAGGALEGAISLAQSVSDQQSALSGQALGLVGAAKGANPVNPVFLIVGIGVALFLARGAKLI